jgi:iron complex outermembrane receptor protein
VHYNVVANNTSTASINIDAITPEVVTFGSKSSRFIDTNYTEQAYLNQNVGFLKDRVIVNASYAYDNYDLNSTDYLFPGTYNKNLEANLRSIGAVLKPLPWLAAYYSYAENATPGADAEGIVKYGSKPFQNGVQNEYGVRFDALEHRLYAVVDYFDVHQSNYSVPNPGNLVIPAPVPALQPLFSDRLAKGWEAELHWVVTSDFSLVGNATTFTNRDPNNIPFRDTPEKSWAILGNYRFAKHSALKGLWLTLGVDYLSNRPGTAASGLTKASTSTAVIPNQPTFYLPARTLVNLGVGYQINKHWKTQLNIENLLDQKYLEASINRFVVYPGAPINIRDTITYSF